MGLSVRAPFRPSSHATMPMQKQTINRRQFVKQSVGTATALTMLSGARVFGANERIVVGVMGTGGRGPAVGGKIAARPEVSIGWLCDPDSRRTGSARQLVEKAQGRAPKCVQDFRPMLEDKSVDAVVNATPDHWHALGTILACQAGKDVYVEKPMAHSVLEGRKMV